MSKEKSKENLGEKNKKIRLTKKQIVLLIVALFIIAIFGVSIGYYQYIKSKVYTEYTPIKKEPTKAVEKDVEYKEVKGITNILLIGTDARELNENARADSIIIATLDDNNKKIKLTSLFRDTLVNIPGYGEDKLNAAMAYGGKELLIETINETYDINIDKFIIINFWGFEAIIDQIGGLEIDVKDYQLDELNKYIGESTGGNDCPVTETGLQLLNGKQALSYARIRYNVGDEYERTERQREVLVKVAEKLRETKPNKYLGIVNKMVDYINTNITTMEALNLAYTIFKFPTLATEQLQIPQTDLAYSMDYKNVGSVFIIDKEQNTDILYNFIFEDKIPNPDDFYYYSLQSIIAEYQSMQLAYEKQFVTPPIKEDTNKKEEVVEEDKDLDFEDSKNEQNSNNSNSNTPENNENNTEEDNKNENNSNNNSNNNNSNNNNTEDDSNNKPEEDKEDGDNNNNSNGDEGNVGNDESNQSQNNG